MRYFSFANKLILPALLALTFSFGAVTSAQAQTRAQIEHRQKMKNEWRNIAYGSGFLAALGLMNNDRTLFFAGTAGALYSLHRYEQDRKSHSRMRRLRAAYFSRPYFYRNGRKYVRRTTVRNGKRYYYFVRAR